MITSTNYNKASINTCSELLNSVSEISHNHRLALKYAAAGIKIFPASPALDQKKSYPTPKKTPALGFLWSQEATTNVDKINEWWGISPDALVSIPVKPNDWIVFDADRPRDNKPDGVEAFESLVKSNGGLPKGTVVIKTQFDGRHYVCRQPKGFLLGNGTGRLPKGIDVRGASGDGGYIIAPGTQWKAPDGSIREWKEVDGSPTLIEAHIEDTIPEAPDFLVKLLRENNQGSLFLNKQYEESQTSLHKKLRQEAISSIKRPHNYSHIPLPDEISETNRCLTQWLEEADFYDEKAYIDAALTYIKSDDRNIWLMVGGALFDKFGELGRSIWDEWSRKSSKFDAEDQYRTWKSFSRPNIVNRSSIGSIVALARDNGFKGRKYGNDPEPYQNIPDSFIKVSQDQAYDSSLPPTVGEYDEKNAHEGVWILGDALPKQQPALVKGLIPTRGLAVLGGQSGAGKTFVSIYLSTALASGLNFFGHTIPQIGGVIYLAFEGGETIAPRLLAARMGLGLSDKHYPVAVISCDLGDLSAPTDHKRLIKRIKYLAQAMHKQFGVPVRMVVVDTLAAAFSIKDENSAGEMSRVCKDLSELGNCINAVTLAVHHYGKNSESGLRGSSSIRALAECVLAVLADRNELKGKCSNRSIQLVKSRTGIEGINHPFDLEGVEIGLDGFEPIVAAKVVPSENSTEGTKVEGTGRGYSPELKRFLSALTQSLIDFGRDERVFADGPILRVVDRERVRENFFANTQADGDAQKANATRRKAFSRSYGAAEQRNLAKCYEKNGTQLMWLLKDGQHE